MWNSIALVHDHFLLSTSLPSNVVLAPSVDRFKSHLTIHRHGYPLKFEASCYTPGVQQKTLFDTKKKYIVTGDRVAYLDVGLQYEG